MLRSAPSDPMIRPLCFAAALAFVIGCDPASTAYDGPKLIPDETPYIIAILEHAPDTLFHHPQVYVALATDQADVNYSLLRDLAHKPNEELWHPVAWAQVGLKLSSMKIRPVAYDRAEVSITGPLGEPDERTVPFPFETRGVYGDAARALNIRPQCRYRLDVRLADGRRYTAETTVPTTTQWTLPDTMDVNVSLQVVAPTNPHNFELGRVRFDWTPPPASESNLTSYGQTGTLQEDYELNQLIPGESLPYEGLNDWVRMGRRFGVFTTSYAAHRHPDLSWGLTSDMPLRHTWRFWTRLYSLNLDLGQFYHPEDQYTEVQDGDPWQQADWNLAAVVSDRDTSYFPRVSNIETVPTEGTPAPRDAAGVFGAFGARYGTTVLRAVRDFDPYAHGWRDSTGTP